MTKKQADVHRRATNMMNVIDRLIVNEQHAQAVNLLERLINAEYLKGFQDGQKRKQRD